MLGSDEKRGGRRKEKWNWRTLARVLGSETYLEALAKLSGCFWRTENGCQSEIWQSVSLADGCISRAAVDWAGVA